LVGFRDIIKHVLVVVEAPIDTISITYLSKEVDIKDEHFERKKKKKVQEVK
jgi:hypothetical protein